MPVIKADVVRLIKEAAESPLEKDQLLVLAGDNTSLWSELHEEDVVTCLWACMHMEGSTRDVATKADIALLAEHIQRLVEQQQHQVTRLHAMQQAISRRKAAKAASGLLGPSGHQVPLFLGGKKVSSQGQRYGEKCQDRGAEWEARPWLWCCQPWALLSRICHGLNHQQPQKHFSS